LVTVAELPVHSDDVVDEDALPDKDPTKFVEVTLVSPDRVVLVPPKAIAVDPIVTELLESLAFAIEPANMVLVTVPVSVV